MAGSHRLARQAFKSPDARRRRRVSGDRLAHRDRRGSTLMIVVVLLGLLSVLGVVFYTFANQERSNAEYYAEAARVPTAPGLTADVLMDHALEQLILGPSENYTNSVLWGRRHSLIANMMGLQDRSLSDLTAFNGQGVNVSMLPGDAPVVDQNQDGTPDAGQLLDSEGNVVFTSSGGSNIQELLNFNDSPAANRLFERETSRFPQPDVGYTYPDHNNVFLAYKGFVRDRSTGQVRLVIIPSFHRPQMYRDAAGQPIPLYEDLNYNGSFDGPDLDTDGNGVLDYGSATANQQFRPHPAHLYVTPGQRPNAASPRYIRTATEAASLLGDAKRVFPFLPMYTGYQPQDAGGNAISFTGRPTEWIGHQGVWSGPHPVDSGYSDPTNTFHDQYQYDVDNDGDGINEGVWLDLDFSPQELADGTLYVPMFSMTVYDLDALFNLNVHGNIQNLLFNGFPFNNSGSRFGTNPVTLNPDFISASNMGLQAGEVNPAWGLTGRPGIDSTAADIATDFEQYRKFFTNNPPDSTSLGSGRASFFETANMDLAFLKMGRPQINSSNTIDEVFAGLYGEESLIYSNFALGANSIINFPRAGQTTADDNGDVNEGMEYLAQYRTGVARNWLDVDQPRDTIGMGSIRATGSVKTLDTTNTIDPASRIKWQRYNRYATNGAVQWGDASLQTGSLMQNNQQYGLLDDPAEVALYAEDRRDVDDPFSPEDAAFLAMSNTDILDAELESRMEQLALFNFSTDASRNKRGEAIRKRFTTQSNDRKAFSLTRAPSGGRVWEWTTDDGQVPQNAGTSPVRFPPTFGNAGAAIRRYSTSDPFRAPVRYLLQMTPGDLQLKPFQQRLAINRVLTFDPNNPGSTELVSRDLTLHPLDPGAAAVPTTQPAYQSTYPWTSAAAQEYWARRDRQMLARDLYVLLYLLGGGETGTATDNPLRTGWTNQYTDLQKEQMARFAVNLVDAQDKDRVMTRFEYDTDLSNGWNLDDNPYTADTSTDRAEVWGQERQELALNELLMFQTEAEMSDSTFTTHGDNEQRQFVCTELRSLVPYDIRFDDTASWQIVLRQRTGTTERRLTLKNNAGTVEAGGFFTLYATDREDPVNSYNATMNPSPSAFRVDPDGSSGLQWIVPRDAAFNVAPSATNNHLDVVASIVSGQTAIEITDENNNDLLTGSNPEGALLSNGAPVTGGGPGNFVIPVGSNIEVVLRRRAHPTRARPTLGNTTEDADNPWVVIDRLSYDTIRNFDYPNTGNAAASQLSQLTSRQRIQPLQGENPQDHGAATIANTFASGNAAENSNAADPYTLDQIHFDRKFTSLAELFHVPLVGPTTDMTVTDPWNGLSRYATAMQRNPRDQYGVPASSTLIDDAKTAIGMFLMPDHPTRTTNAWDDNRWYRLLELIEIPTRQNVDLAIGTEFEIKRVPGKINLNTLRNSEVVAGVVDDESLHDLDPTNDADINPANPNRIELPRLRGATDTNVDLFEQIQASRDPRDPFWSGFTADLRLPGLPADFSTAAPARPFRSLAYLQPDGNALDSLQHTLLRDLPLDAGQTERRQLFEIGTQGEHANSNPTEIHPSMRHQVLSKIWNNTTVRSNTFVVFISVKLFRAAQAPGEDVNGNGILDTGEDTNGNGQLDDGAVRIGGPLKEFQTGVEEDPEQPEFRGVFIVDRSLVEKGVSSGGGGFTDFRPFVTYRKILQEE